MNYLGHFYLSGDDPDVIYGNFIGDVVKGNKWNAYPESIQKGILLHRFIDDFTDHHPETKSAKSLIRSHFSITSAIVIDMYFDHFLSLHWPVYCKRHSLVDFSDEVFNKLSGFSPGMPSYTGLLFRKMRDEHWLLSYKSIDGISFALNRMGKRVRFENNWDRAKEVLTEHYRPLENSFHRFFPDIISAVQTKFSIKLDESP